MDRVLETLVLQDYEVVFEVNPATGRFRKIISRPDALVRFPDEGQLTQARDFIVTDKIFEADRSIFLSETQLDHVLAKMKGNEPLSVKYRGYSDKTSCITGAFPSFPEKTVRHSSVPFATRRMRSAGNTKKTWICGSRTKVSASLSKTCVKTS